MTTHSRCGATWGGMNTAHCAGCCTTWTGVTAFDTHRKGGVCATPESIGMVQTGRDYPCYGLPSDGTSWWPTGDAA
jgi:hypothetical protein